MARTRKQKTPPMTVDRAIQLVLWKLEDKLGGEGWDDPRLVDAMRGWVSIPFDIDWSEWSAEKEAEELIAQSFDPRDMVDRAE